MQEPQITFCWLWSVNQDTGGLNYPGIQSYKKYTPKQRTALMLEIKTNLSNMNGQPLCSALCFPCFYIYRVLESTAKSQHGRCMCCRCRVCTVNSEKVAPAVAPLYLPNIGQANYSNFQGGAKPSNQRRRLWCIISLSLRKTTRKASNQALAIT